MHEPSQASIVALLLELAGEPAAAEGAPARDEQRFPWRWSALSEAATSPDEYPAPRENADEPIAAEHPSVAYLLPGLPPEGSGGSHSLVQEARGLRALGVQARICVPEDSLWTAAALYGNDDGLFATYRTDPASPGQSDSSLLGAVAGAGVVVASEYPSVELLARLSRERTELVCAYYVQDYEPLFWAARTERSDRALLSYRAIPGQILFAKTHWLRNVVGELHAVPIAKVRPSLDRELFHARGREDRTGALRVAAMIRPRTPRRRPAGTLEALSAIGGALGEAVEIATFGCDEDSLSRLGGPAPKGARHLGLLSREQVSELMRRSDVFIDGSAYQAFGRTGFEAMACGAVPLLPALGGVREYAVDGENALILNGHDAEAMAEAVIGLARDVDGLSALSARGVRAAEGFSIEAAARSQLELFSKAVRFRKVAA